MGQVCGLYQVDQSTVAVKEKFGKFNTVLSPSYHCVPWFCGVNVAGVLSLHIQQLDVQCKTKSKDNVFVTMVASVQYRAHIETAEDAFYKLTNPWEQIKSYVFDAKMLLDDVFEQKNDIAKNVEEELEKFENAFNSPTLAGVMEDVGISMRNYGYEIVQTLIVDIELNETVKQAMNEINARVGVARQCQTIVDGLRESVLAFSDNYFDTMKEIGAISMNSTVFIPHGPGVVRDVAKQIRNGLLQGQAGHMN
ncbi:hypothetical protein CY35_19G022000 [Sphagnum magellanicum]|nr:hypothetical protein CY35_19G022000 [Sphagnum magellanicum]